jgi:hypothetical protein
VSVFVPVYVCKHAYQQLPVISVLEVGGRRGRQRYMKVDELLHKLKDPCARRWNSRDVGTFFKGVQY